MVTSNSSSAADAWRRDLLWLAVGFAALYFFALGRCPLDYKDEGRYAEIPREMVATGDWVTPRLDGVVYFEKPPLMYWLVAVCLEVFGPGEASMRATPAAFALAGVLLTYAAARRLHGRGAGLASALVLGTSAFYFAIGHILILDMAVSVLTSAALFCFILGVFEAPGSRRRALFYGLYASAALATLTKGLMGFLIPGAIMLLWLVLFGQWRRLRPLYLPSGLALFLALAAPWHVLVALRNPTWAYRYFVYEHWLRFTTPAAGRHEPWWIYIPVVLAGLFPWMGFLWPALRAGLGGGWARRREHAQAGFLALWAAFVVLFFSISHSKLLPYVLPAFPPLAVLIGAWLAGEGREPARLRRGLGPFSFVCGVLAAAALVAVLRPGLAVKDPVQARELVPYAWALAVGLGAGGVAAPVLAAAFGRRGAFAGIGATMAVFFGVLVLARPALQKPGTKPLALIVRAQAGPDDEIVCYHEFFHDFLFYSRRLADVVAFQGELEPEEDPSARARGRFIDQAEFLRRWAGPRRVFAIMRRADAGPLLADPTFHSYLLGQTRDHYLLSNRP